jgi:hypothetical protein
MAHLILSGDNTAVPGFSLLDETSLAITLDDTGTLGFALSFLVLSGPASVSIASMGTTGGLNKFPQLDETKGDLTTVTITGSEPFFLGAATGNANSGDGVVTDIAAKANHGVLSSLTLIDASAATGQVDIFAGATNRSSAGSFENGGTLNANVAISYHHLEIKGGSGIGDHIENDATRNGIVTDGNGDGDTVVLGGADAKATVGTGTHDTVAVGLSGLGLVETAGSALGDTVKFGSAATAELTVGTGAEVGPSTNIGLTKVLDAAAGMLINFTNITSSSNIVDETAKVASLATLTAAENAAVDALGVPGVAYFKYQGNEYFIATNNAETAVSADDAIVKLVGVTDIHHATNSFGSVTLHV